MDDGISYGRNDPEAEEENLLKAVGLNRHDLVALTGLARLCYKMRRFNEAYELFQEAVSLDSSNFSLWFYLGRCCEELDKRVEAINAYGCCSEAGGGQEWQVEERIVALKKGLTGVESQRESQKILSPKRILVISNLYPPQELGGYGRLMCDFANILERRGHNVYVLTSDTPYLGCIDKDEPNIDRGLVLCGGWQNGASKLINDNDKILQIVRGNSEKMHNVIHMLRPELCLSGNIDFLSYTVLEPLLGNGIPVIHHVGNDSPGYVVDDTPRSDLYRLAAASRWVRDVILQEGYPLGRISVVYPGALVKEFKMHILPAQDKLRVAYASIVLPYKGPQILIEALSSLHERGVDFHCSLAGSITDERFVDELRKFIADAGMEDKVEFLGFLPRKRLKGFFARHNVLAFPSVFQEPFGISQVEAMAAGLAVVSSGTGGAREIVEHGVSGLIFESENSESLARELLWLAENPEKWREIAREGQKRAMEEFDIEKSVDRLEQEFLTLINCRCLSAQDQGVCMKSPDALYGEIRKMVTNGSQRDAIGALKMFLETYPDYGVAHNDLGVLYYNEGEKKKALEHYEQAARLEPVNATFQKNLADFYYVEFGRVEEAMELYGKILKVNPTDVEALLILGTICVSLEKSDDASFFYERVLELEPCNADARERLDVLSRG
jgi:glycosyltransferase involved in cell wall biosynthesis/Flp pilus assembly protein TadD